MTSLQEHSSQEPTFLCAPITWASQGGFTQIFGFFPSHNPVGVEEARPQYPFWISENSMNKQHPRQSQVSKEKTGLMISTVARGSK